MSKDLGKVVDKVAARVLLRSYDTFPEIKALMDVSKQTVDELGDKGRIFEMASRKVSDNDIKDAIRMAMVKIQAARQALIDIMGAGQGWVVEREKGFMSSDHK